MCDLPRGHEQLRRGDTVGMRPQVPHRGQSTPLTILLSYSFKVTEVYVEVSGST